MSEHNCDGWDSCPNPAPRKPTPTGFLLARIAEDEAVARAAMVMGQGVDTIGTHSLPEFAEHVTAWQPARVLAECEAKRQIVEDATGQHTSSVEGYAIMRILATVYADHPDYREEWKP